ncbi:MAG: thioredoxin-like domain-containing protein [Bacteroidota bacterium]|nr:thioredoxin-like domain-containing protein [Bacteroidota bacterium]
MTARLKTIFILLLLSAGLIFSQEMNMQIKGASGKAFLYELSGEKAILFDSIPPTSTGVYDFSFAKSKKHEGLYRLAFEPKKVIDFVYDGKDISLKTNANTILDSMQVIKSESNRLFYAFMKLNKLYKTKAELLQVILYRYPKDDDYYSATENKLISLQSEYSSFINNTSQKDRSSFIARYIRSAQLPVVDIGIPPEKQLEYLKGHSLDKVNFNDYELVYSDVFSNKAIEYLTYYRNPQLPKELLEQEFMKAADTLFNKAKVNQAVYQHFVEYLIDGFKKFGFDKILDYIVENYVIKDGLCLDIKTEGLIKKRIDQAKILKVGAVVPNIISADTSGNKFELYDNSNNQKILLVFYASWCPHCKELLPVINKIKNIKVVAVSMDTNREDWINFIKSNSLSFLNVSDLKGWDSKAAIDYYIYATPTMFVIDSNKKIINKSINIEELNRFLSK